MGLIIEFVVFVSIVGASILFPFAAIAFVEWLRKGNQDR